VIPALVGGIQMPKADNLPAPLGQTEVTLEAYREREFFQGCLGTIGNSPPTGE
jgi:hypothetical protein